MKKKQKREWCHLSDHLQFDVKLVGKSHRCECGKRVKILPQFDFWDVVKINGHWVPEIVFGYLSPHKTKVKYKE